MRATVEERFWAKVRKTDGCWFWTASTKKRGYGQLTIRHGVVRLASRFSWTLHNGPIPEGLFVCHTCDTPPCVNPAHLWLGTHTDNMRDMIAKGRHVGSTGKFKTHCVHGHEYTPENTARNGRGGYSRRCRVCHRVDECRRKNLRQVNRKAVA